MGALNPRFACVSRKSSRQVVFDIYNLFHTDVITSYNQRFEPNGSWQTPTSIQPARYVKVNAQVDF